MEKAICLKCGSVGYSAAPNGVRCECSGRCRVYIEEKGEKSKKENHDHKWLDSGIQCFEMLAAR